MTNYRNHTLFYADRPKLPSKLTCVGHGNVLSPSCENHFLFANQVSLFGRMLKCIHLNDLTQHLTILLRSFLDDFK